MFSKIKTWITAKLSALWAWLKKSCLHSLTVLCAYLYALLGAFIAYGDVVGHALAQTFNDPAFDQLKSMLPPKWTAIAAIATGALFFLARMRGKLKEMKKG